MFEELFQMMLKMQLEMLETTKVIQFHSHFRKKALHTFRSIKASNKRTREEVLNIFR